MTTIAYKHNILAADTAMATGGGIVGSYEKIFRNKKGDLAGATGNLDFCSKFKDWFLRGEKGKPPSAIVPGKPDETDKAFIIRHKPRCILHYEGTQFSEIETGPYAVGSGAPEARGAMFAGATAIEAVTAAIALDTATGGDITVLGHTGFPRRIKVK